MNSREGVIGGAALALSVDVLLRRRASRERLAIQGAGLIVAAGIYPALHKRSAGRAGPGERGREVAGVAAASALVVSSLAKRHTSGRQLLAAGWAAHALFDAVHHRGETSLLPDWYPAVCAGYDLATAAAILAPVH